MGIHDALREIEAAAGLVKEAFSDDALVSPAPVEAPRMHKGSGAPPVQCTKNSGCIHVEGDGHEGGCVFEGEFSPVDPQPPPEPAG